MFRRAFILGAAPRTLRFLYVVTWRAMDPPRVRCMYTVVVGEQRHGRQLHLHADLQIGGQRYDHLSSLWPFTAPRRTAWVPVPGTAVAGRTGFSV